ncbi:MAG TPA: hypothetical protein VD971_08080 [Phycisphaerales bacterium]|nr:hypothetical protein [Phycisphaerales bacterium]
MCAATFDRHAITGAAPGRETRGTADAHAWAAAEVALRDDHAAFALRLAPAHARDRATLLAAIGLCALAGETPDRPFSVVEAQLRACPVTPQDDPLVAGACTLVRDGVFDAGSLVDLFDSIATLSCGPFPTWDALQAALRLAATNTAKALTRLGIGDGRTNALASLFMGYTAARRLARVGADVASRGFSPVLTLDTGLTPAVAREWRTKPNEPHVRRRTADELRAIATRARAWLLASRPLGDSAEMWATWYLRAIGDATLDAVARERFVTLWTTAEVYPSTAAFLRCKARVGSVLRPRG